MGIFPYSSLRFNSVSFLNTISRRYTGYTKRSNLYGFSKVYGYSIVWNGLCVHSGEETMNSFRGLCSPPNNRPNAENLETQKFLRMMPLDEYPVPEVVLRIESEDVLSEELSHKLE